MSTTEKKKVSAPTLGANPTTPTYDTSSYDKSTKGTSAWTDYQTSLNEVKNHGNLNYAYQDYLNDTMKSIMNREKFSYDLNGDALYQQYKDKYIQQGKMAMGDAIGQASAMTGGYGNSYAQSVGQQAYQAQLQNLNDIVPELYQMAYDKHNQETQDLYNKYGMLTDDYDRAYAENQDEYNKKMDILGIARSDYYDGANMFYTEQGNKNDVESKQFNDAMTLLERDDNNAWAGANWDREQTWRDEDREREQTWRDEDIAYRDGRDKIEDEQWAKEYALNALKGGATVDNNGNLTPIDTSKEEETSKPSVGEIKAEVGRYPTQAAKSEYLAELVNEGKLDADEAASILAGYDLTNTKWTVTDDGGINLFGIGIDADARVKDQYNNEYSLDELRTMLMKQNDMTKKEATAWIKENIKGV